MPVDTTDQTAAAQRRSRLFFHACALALGVAMLIIGLVSHQLGFGISGIVVMVAYSVMLLVLSRRHEAAQLLSGSAGDERQAAMLTKSLSTTGQILLVVLVGWLLVATAMKSDTANVLSILCAIGGVSFIASTAYYSRRG